MGDITKITSLLQNKTISIQICNKNVKYDYLTINENGISNKPNIKQIQEKYKLSCKENLGCGDCKIQSEIIKILHVDGILTHYFIQELRISPTYRKKFIEHVKLLPGTTEHIIIFRLIPAKKEIIDYNWNYRTINLAWERVELDHALSWLSTLGGAFSALGDYFSNCAVMAGKISFHQLKLALRLGDPTVASRCRLYFSLSLIQRGYFKCAKKIIQKEYIMAKNALVVDTRLIKMCLGIWAKLKYEYGRNRLYGK